MIQPSNMLPPYYSTTIDEVSNDRRDKNSYYTLILAARCLITSAPVRGAHSHNHNSFGKLDIYVGSDVFGRLR